MVVSVTLLKGRVLFIELAFKDYFYSVSISAQDIKLTSAIDLFIRKEMFIAV